MPVKMHLYIKALAFALNQSLNTVYQECAERFLAGEPWKHGLRWRESPDPSSRIPGYGKNSVSGWTRVMVRVQQDIGLRLEAVAEEEHIALPNLYYTMLYWWVWYQYPPVYERERRAKLLQESKS